MINRAMRLGPGFSRGRLLILGAAYRFCGKFSEAIAPLRKIVAHDPEFLDARIVLAAAYAEPGHNEKACDQAMEIQRLGPRFSTADYIARLPLRNQEVQTCFGTDLRKTGLPD